MSNLKTITPQAAAALIKQGAVLVDVREANEHALERIPGAHHHALTRIDGTHPIRPGDEVLIFHCKSGGRTTMHAAKLSAAAGDCEAYVLGGGIEAWKKAGLPVEDPAARSDTPGNASKISLFGWMSRGRHGAAG
jgi:rhodanese-related sulfurtransferase